MIKSQPKKESKNFSVKIKRTARNKIRNIIRDRSANKERLDYWKSKL